MCHSKCLFVKPNSKDAELPVIGIANNMNRLHVLFVQDLAQQCHVGIVASKLHPISARLCCPTWKRLVGSEHLAGLPGNIFLFCFREGTICFCYFANPANELY